MSQHITQCTHGLHTSSQHGYTLECIKNINREALFNEGIDSYRPYCDLFGREYCNRKYSYIIGRSCLMETSIVTGPLQKVAKSKRVCIKPGIQC